MLVRLSALTIAAGIMSATVSVSGLSPSDIPTDTPVSSLLASAQNHLSKGETSDALVYYDAAIALDSKNYLTFFKRATTYLSLGRMPQATNDLDQVLLLKPGFEGAHVQLGKIRGRTGDWDGAIEHYRLANRAEEAAAIEEARKAAALAEAAKQSGDWEECATQAGAAIFVAQRALDLRELRAHCVLERGDIAMGLHDLQAVLQMKPGETKPHLAISAMKFYALGDMQEGMAAIRKCLHSDPESKVCKKLLRQEKTTEKIYQKAAEALKKGLNMSAMRHLLPRADSEGLVKEVKEQVKSLRQEGIIHKMAGDALAALVVEMTCQACFMTKSKEAGQYCTESLQFDENALYGLLHRARTEEEAEDYEASVKTLRAAAAAHPDKEDEIQKLLHKAYVALKRSKTKDYYKVLGVAHDADERQIKSAYRKLSKVHHPDKAHKQGLTKEQAEKKMASINEAYEVLSNPELRARFDSGDDPNSQERQGDPFQGSPSGNGPTFMFQQGGPGVKFSWSGGGFPGGF